MISQNQSVASRELLHLMGTAAARVRLAVQQTKEVREGRFTVVLAMQRMLRARLCLQRVCHDSAGRPHEKQCQCRRKQ